MPPYRQNPPVTATSNHFHSHFRNFQCYFIPRPIFILPPAEFVKYFLNLSKVEKNRSPFLRKLRLLFYYSLLLFFCLLVVYFYNNRCGTRFCINISLSRCCTNLYSSGRRNRNCSIPRILTSYLSL